MGFIVMKSTLTGYPLQRQSFSNSCLSCMAFNPPAYAISSAVIVTVAIIHHFFLLPVLFGDMLPTFLPGGMWRDTVFGLPGLVCPPNGWLHAFIDTPCPWG